jgi:heptose I phosphotransferase
MPTTSVAHARTLRDRLTRGSRWYWTSDDYRAALPDDLAEGVLAIQSSDRLHAKQGRSTARVRFDSPYGSLSVFLKRHFRLPWMDRLAALVHPAGRHTPGAAEWGHLRRARSLGVNVPDPVAAGEWIGPWGRLQSFLMVAELDGCELHEALPQLRERLGPLAFEQFKRELVVEMAGMAARLHAANLYHKDLYLCHFFIDPDRPGPAGERLTLIDLHRLAEHRWWATRWRAKDLGQLLFSTFDLEEGLITDRDRLRFWSHYQRLQKLNRPAFERRWIERKAALYRRHNGGTVR